MVSRAFLEAFYAWHAKLQPVFKAEILGSRLYIWHFCLLLVKVRQPMKLRLILFFSFKKYWLEKFLLPVFGLIDFVLAQTTSDLISMSSSVWGGSDFSLPLHKRLPSPPGNKVGAEKEGKGGKRGIHSNCLVKIHHQGPKANKKAGRTSLWSSVLMLKHGSSHWTKRKEATLQLFEECHLLFGICCH